MVKGVATSIITVVVLMGSLVACGSSSEGDAKKWVTDYFVEAYEPAWESLEIKSLTARDFVKECYLDEFEDFSYRNGEDDYWQITKSNFIDGSYSGVRNSEANEKVITCLTDRTTGAEFLRLNNVDLAGALTFEKDTGPKEVSWSDFLELVDLRLIETMIYDTNTGEIQATDSFGYKIITSGPLELSPEVEKLLTDNIPLLLSGSDNQDPEPCQSFDATSTVYFGESDQNPLTYCVIAPGSYTLNSIHGINYCRWIIRASDYKENIVGKTYREEATVIIPDFDSNGQPYLSIKSTNCTEWIRN